MLASSNCARTWAVCSSRSYCTNSSYYHRAWNLPPVSSHHYQGGQRAKCSGVNPTVQFHASDSPAVPSFGRKASLLVLCNKRSKKIRNSKKPKWQQKRTPKRLSDDFMQAPHLQDLISRTSQFDVKKEMELMFQVGPAQEPSPLGC